MFVGMRWSRVALRIFMILLFVSFIGHGLSLASDGDGLGSVIGPLPGGAGSNGGGEGSKGGDGSGGDGIGLSGMENGINGSTLLIAPDISTECDADNAGSASGQTTIHGDDESDGKTSNLELDHQLWIDTLTCFDPRVPWDGALSIITGSYAATLMQADIQNHLVGLKLERSLATTHALAIIMIGEMKGVTSDNLETSLETGHCTGNVYLLPNAGTLDMTELIRFASHPQAPLHKLGLMQAEYDSAGAMVRKTSIVLTSGVSEEMLLGQSDKIDLQVRIEVK